MIYRHRWIWPCGAPVPRSIEYYSGPTRCQLDHGHDGWHRVNFASGRALTWDEWDA